MKRILSFLVVAVVLASALALPAFAAAGGTDITDIMDDGLTAMKGDVLSIIAVALPIALGIFALFFGVRKGIQMLRGTTT
jgi:type IV secretory pathway VirB2 component (pilin)